MSTNCIHCVVKKRTGPDLLCDACRHLTPALSPSNAERGPSGCGWKQSEPPKDGTRFVAIGRIIWSDEFSTVCEPFLREIYWEKTDSGFEGWMADNLALSCGLYDKVKIDFWIELPNENPPVSQLEKSEAARRPARHTALTQATQALSAAGCAVRTVYFVGQYSAKSNDFPQDSVVLLVPVQGEPASLKQAHDMVSSAKSTDLATGHNPI